jgi:glycosyltransferase involved in cell wall biosynthesis
MRPLRIGVLGIRGLPSGYSGLETSCERLYSLLAARGHEIFVYCRTDGGKDRPKIYRGMHLVTAPSFHSKSVDTLSHVGASLVHALLFGNYDIIHFHAEAPGLFVPVCRLLKKPTVATVHGLDWQRARWKGPGSSVLRFAERRLAEHADEIITVSQDLRNYFAVQYERESHYIPNGIGEPGDGAEIDESVLRKYGLERQGYVLYLARLVPEKRVEDLLHAFASLQTPLKLIVAGKDGPGDEYVDQLKRIAASDGRVIFTGFQDRSSVQCLFRNAVAYVLPSELEGLPLSLLECIEAGTPAIVTDIPPHRELLNGVEDYDLYFPPADVTALKTRLQRVLSDYQHYREVAARIREDVHKRFDWGGIADQTEKLYFDVLEKHGALREIATGES